jgi:hypothetical protein
VANGHTYREVVTRYPLKTVLRFAELAIARVKDEEVRVAYLQYAGYRLDADDFTKILANHKG